MVFEVPDVEKAIKGLELLGEPNCPMEGVKVAMLKHNGTPIEPMEIKKQEKFIPPILTKKTKMPHNYYQYLGLSN